MKLAHKYRLKVNFSSGVNWNFEVVAVNVENVSTFIPRQETDERYILSSSIELIERNFEEVKDNFCAKTL